MRKQIAVFVVLSLWAGSALAEDGYVGSPQGPMAANTERWPGGQAVQDTDGVAARMSRGDRVVQAGDGAIGVAPEATGATAVAGR